MKFAIVHLTDIHAKEDFDYKCYSSIISEALFGLSPDRCSICISGDLTQSGDASQYNQIDNFINQLKATLETRNIPFGRFVFVPGNHDIKYGQEEKRQRSYLHGMGEKDYFDRYPGEITKFDNFYSYSEFYELPDLRKNISRELPYIDEIVDGLTIRYYLLNNAVYTSYRADNNEDSKGTVMIPKEMTNSISNQNDTVNFLLMHFPLSYLDDDSFNRLQDKMRLLTYILTGHTHNKSELSYSTDDTPCAISIGYAIENNCYPNLDNGFSVLVFDTVEKTITNHTYIIKKQHAVKETERSTGVRIPHLENPFTRTEEFDSFLNEQDSCDAPLSKTFVFPELELEEQGTTNESGKVASFDDFQVLATKGVPVLVRGPSKSGKTSLLKALHGYFDSIGVPIMLNWKAISNSEQSECIIKDALEKQYNDSFSWQLFNSLPKQKRIVLIDDANFEEDVAEIISLLQSYFGVVVLTFCNSRYDARKQLLTGLLANNPGARPVVLNIRPMFFNKRKELISKCYNALSQEKHKLVSVEGAEQFFNNVQNALDRFVGTDSNYPYFIGMTSSSFFGQRIVGGASSRGLYNEIYGAHITHLVEKAFKNNESALVALKVLPLLAYEIFNRDCYCMKSSEAIEIVEELKKKRNIRGDDFGSLKIINSLVKARVLCENDNNIAFTSVDFLAYFAAKNCSELIDSEFDKYINKVDESLDCCYHNAHVRFLLFLAFFSKKRVYEYLIDKADEYCKNHSSVDVTEMEFAKRDKESSNIKPLTKKQKKEIESKRHNQESNFYDKKEEEYKNEVDGNIREEADDAEKDFARGFGVLALISSLIPDFKMELEPEEQDRCISILYKLPEIITFLDNQYINNNFDSVIEEVQEQFGKNQITIKKERVEAILVNISRARMLSVFDYAMNSAHTKLTEYDLCDKKYAVNGTGRLLRLMSMVFDSNPSETFEKLAPDYFSYFTTSPFARNCISLIVRYYITWIVPQSQLIGKRDFLLLFYDKQSVEETIKGLVFRKTDKV